MLCNRRASQTLAATMLASLAGSRKEHNREPPTEVCKQAPPAAGAPAALLLHTRIVWVKLQRVLERLNLELRQEGRGGVGRGERRSKPRCGGGRRQQAGVAARRVPQQSGRPDRTMHACGIVACGGRARRRAERAELARPRAVTAQQQPGGPGWALTFLTFDILPPRKRGRPSGAPPGSPARSCWLCRAPGGLLHPLCVGAARPGGPGRRRARPGVHSCALKLRGRQPRRAGGL